MHLPNINVWLALTFDSHVHHPSAKTWFDGLPNDAICFFCRLTQQGFLRLAQKSFSTISEQPATGAGNHEQVNSVGG